MRAGAAAALLVAAIAVTAIAIVGSDRGDDAGVAALHVAPVATGDCTPADPCSLSDALGRDVHGAVVSLGSGRYPRLVLGAEAGGVTLRPGHGETPVIEAIELHAPDVHLRDVRVAGGILVSRAGAGAVVSGSSVGALAIHGDRTVVRRSQVGGTTDKDPIQITESAAGVVIEGNEVGDGARGSGRGHVDCIQITSGSDITIRGNDLRQCSNAALLVKPDLGDIHDLTIEDNRLAACSPKGPACESGIALYVRQAAHAIAGVVIRGNEVRGSSSFDHIEGLVLEDNVLQTLSRAPACPKDSRNNTILDRHAVACPLGASDRYADGAA